MRKYCGLLLYLLASFAYGQQVPSGYPAFHPNLEVRVPNLPALMARTKDSSDVLLTSLDIVFQDHTICCGRDSALEDSAAAADPRSMKDITSRLQGRHLLSDGRPISVTVVDLATSALNPAPIVDSLVQKHALLMMWKSRLYVLYGALYDEGIYEDGGRTVTVNKFYLLDTRYSDERRQATFNRSSDSWSDVQGLLLLTFSSL